MNSLTKEDEYDTKFTQAYNAEHTQYGTRDQHNTVTGAHAKSSNAWCGDLQGIKDQMRVKVILLVFIKGDKEKLTHDAEGRFWVQCERVSGLDYSM